MHADPSSSIDLEKIFDGHDISGFMEAKSIEACQTDLQIVRLRTLAELIRKLDCSTRSSTTVSSRGCSMCPTRAISLDVVFFTQTCAVNNINYHVQRGLLPLLLSGGSVEVPGLPPLEPPETPSFFPRCLTAEHGPYIDIIP
ncbi:UDP-glycosyltransferase 74G1-like [Syzygium oleosum]|uniref:UDP-glycosyltransferase 74G1-like n=1 Tax=Syzygium oleosum TaxID=219896 RepID=UPI0024BA1A60|nr:UDP-glycosyltransferase 74G1-like [Syzygium oleosum]